MTIDYKDYPPDWAQIRMRVLRRARESCEFCQVPNLEFGYRDAIGQFHILRGNENPPDRCRRIMIQLTIAHLDHDAKNHAVTDERLRALCQRCHFAYDRIGQRARTEAATGQQFLDPEPH